MSSGSAVRPELIAARQLTDDAGDSAAAP